MDVDATIILSTHRLGVLPVMKVGALLLHQEAAEGRCPLREAGVCRQGGPARQRAVQARQLQVEEPAKALAEGPAPHISYIIYSTFQVLELTCLLADTNECLAPLQRDRE